MSRNKNVQQYVGYMLSMANATLWDNSAIAYPLDQEAFEKAEEIVRNLFTREIEKNQNRIDGAYGFFDEIGKEASQ